MNHDINCLIYRLCIDGKTRGVKVKGRETALTY